MPEREEPRLGPIPDPSRVEAGSGTTDLAGLIIVGLLGYAGVKQIPSSMRRGAALKLEELISKKRKTLPWLNRVIPGITEDLGDARLHAKDPALVGSSQVDRRFRGVHATEELDALKRMSGAQFGAAFGGNVNAAHNAVLEQYFVGTYRDITAGAAFGTQYQPLTFHDVQRFSRANKAGLDKLQKRQPEAYDLIGKAGRSLDELMAIPTFKRNMEGFKPRANHNLTPAELSMMSARKGEEALRNFVIPHVYMSSKSKAFNLKTPGMSPDAWIDQMLQGTVQIHSSNRWKPSNILKSIVSSRIPFTPFRPGELVVPSELINSQPVVSMMGPELAKSLGSKNPTGTLFASGKIFGIHGRQIGYNQLASGYKLGYLASGMGKAWNSRMGIQPPGYGDVEKHKFGTPDAWWKKAYNAMLDFGDRIGIGPQFHPTPDSRGFVANTLGNLRRKAQFKPVITNAPDRAVSPAYGVTPEGANLNRMIKRRTGIQGVTDTPSSVRDLSWWEKLKLAIGFEPTRAYVERRSKREVAQLMGIPVDQVTDTMQSRGALRLRKREIARYGELSAREGVDTYVQKGGRYAYSSGQGVGNWLNWLAHRPAWLLQEGTGVGLRQGKTVLGTMGTWLAVGVGAQASFQVLDYADYKSGAITGVRPKEVAGGLLVGTQYAINKLQDASGVTATATSLEEQFPGIESSTASQVLRGGAAVLGGAAAGNAAGGRKGGLIGLGLGAALGLMQFGDLTKTSDQFWQEVQGERNVEIKRGRWWTLGRQPFEGQGTKAFVPHWFQRMRSNYKETSIYGSKKESWRGSWLPTPENLFLLKNIYDPYYVERRNYTNRPYPVSAPLLHDVPLIGPALSGTIGRIIKPEQRMHMGGMQFPVASDERTTSANADMDLGMSHVQRVAPKTYATRNSADLLAQQAIYNLKEFSGMPGFLYEAGIDKLKDGQFPASSPFLADAGAIASASRDLYDQNLGGLLGYTELVRRFVPRDNRKMAINYLGNTMPDWLPGRNSAFKHDRKPTRDFHVGDAYIKMDMGEARLPGPGYEALHRLHSGSPGIYDPVDRLMILSDIAPASEAYKHYKTIVEGWAKSGVLDQSWSGKAYRAMDQAQAHLERQPAANERRFTRQRFYKTQLAVDQVMDASTFRSGGNTFSLAGVEANIDRLASRSPFSRNEQARLENTAISLQSELSSLQGQNIDALVGMGNDGIFPVVLGGLNKRYIDKGLQGELQEPIAAYAKYGDQPAAAAWENLQHSQLPGPLGWIPNKVFGRYDSVERYQREVMEGGDFAGWLEPYDNFIRPWMMQTRNMMLPGVAMTSEEARRRNVDEYFDKMEYYKYRSAQVQARMAGMGKEASFYQHKMRQTAIGMSAPGPTNVQDAFMALPAVERGYIQNFSKIQSEEQRARVLDMTPEFTHPVFMGVWGTNDPKLVLENPIMSHTSQLYGQAQRSTEKDIDAQVANFFAHHPLPDSHWAGWDPEVNKQDIRVSTINNSGEDLHAYGMWEGQLNKVRFSAPMVYSAPAISAFASKHSYDSDRFNEAMKLFNTGKSNLMPYNRLRYRRKKNHRRMAEYPIYSSGRF